MSRRLDALPLWQRDESLRRLEARLAPSAARPRVVSFDFFDTLIFRLSAEPSHLFVELGRKLASAGLLRSEISPTAFRAVRMAGEAKAREEVARTGRCPEITLADIYTELGEVVADPVAARELELTIERSVGFPNPAMVAAVEYVRALGCRTAIVSDSYFSAEQLLRLLDDHGVPRSLFDGIFVSSERGKAKWHSGTLYQDLLRQFDVHPGEVLHIGPDPYADVYMARRLGIDALPYYRTTPVLRSIFKGECAELSGGEAPFGSLEAVRVLASRRADGENDAYRDGALVLGPVLSRFAEWCVGQYARAGVTRVLALMPEGELLGELLRRSAAASGANLEVVACYASHIATARAAMADVSVESAMALFDGAHPVTPQAILRMLGLGPEAAQFLDAETLQKPLASQKAANDLLRVLFRMPLIRERIEQGRRESQDLAFAYLSELIGDGPKVGVLALGWSGSTQRNIACILRHKARNVRTIGCYLACTARAARLALEGHEAHAYLTSEWDRIGVLPEACIAACVGRTSGYARHASGRVEPVLESIAPMPDQLAIQQRLRDGVFGFQELWLEINRRPKELVLPASVLSDIDRLSAPILYRWMDFPTKPEADRLGGLCLDQDDFGQARNAPLCDEENRIRFRREGARAIFENSRCYWPQGVIAQVYPRMISVVQRGFRDPEDLGRLGASHASGRGETAILDSELVSLDHWLGKFAPRQMVWCGRAEPSVVALLAAKSSTELASDAPRLIVVEGGSISGEDTAAVDPSVTREGRSGEGEHVRVRGAFDDPETLRATRALLAPSGAVALILTSDVAEAEVEPLLHGLAPFLGSNGIVLAASGRYHGDEMEAPTAIGRPLKAWLSHAAAKLGFALYRAHGGDRVGARDWIVLWHSPDAMDWAGQWMPMVADLDCDADTAAGGGAMSGTHA